MALGHTNREIGEQLSLSMRTVETHRSHIQQKLGLESRPDLTRYALENRLIDAWLLLPGVAGSSPRCWARSAVAGSAKRTRASTATAPSGVAITGFRSSSAISGWASTIAPTRSEQLLERLDVGRRARRGSRQQRVGRRATRSISAASAAVERADPHLRRRPSSSTAVPPAPQATTGPKTGSVTTPTSISTPSSTIAWTRKRLAREPARPARLVIALAAAPTSSAPASPSRDRAELGLVEDAGAGAFSATLPPISSAAAPAAAGSPASRESGSRDPVAVEQPLALARGSSHSAPGGQRLGEHRGGLVGTDVVEARRLLRLGRRRHSHVAHDPAQRSGRVLRDTRWVGTAAPRGHRPRCRAVDMKTARTGSSRGSSAAAAPTAVGDVLGPGQRAAG